MISRINRWMRIHGPPWWTVTCVLVVFSAFELMCFTALGEDEQACAYRARAAVAVLAAIAFGLYRVRGFHPIFREGFRQWLEQSAWTPRQPLPFGSPRLGAGDLILVACLCGFSARGFPIGAAVSAVGFIAAYCLATCVMAALCRLRISFYLLAFGLALALRLGPHPLMAVGAVAVLFPIAIDAMQRSLDPARWPTKDSWASKLASVPHLRLRKGNHRNPLGWPHSLVSPTVPPRLFAWPERVLLPLLGGAFIYAAFASTTPNPPGTKPLAFIAVIFVVASRFDEYTKHRRSPISFWGRLVTGRWIVPGYDRVILEPLAALAAFIAAMKAVIYLFNLPGAVALSLLTAGYLFIFLNVGPSLAEWQLTGKFRVSTSYFSSNPSHFDRA